VGAYRIFQTTAPSQGGLAPTFLLQPAGIAFEGGLGDAKDALADRIKLAVLARFPNYAPPDALQALGIERNLPRGPSETDATYAARLVNAWSTWPWAGTPYGLLQALKSAGYANVIITQVRRNYFSLDPNGNLVITSESGFSWTMDPSCTPALSVWSAGGTFVADQKVFPAARNGYWYSTPNGGTAGGSAPAWPTTIGQTVTDNGIIWCCYGYDFWSRFDVVFTAPLPSGQTSGTSDESNRIRALIAAWKPAHSLCNRITIVTAGRIWGLPQTPIYFGGGSTFGGGTAFSGPSWGTPGVTWGGATTVNWTP
jgi:hypothetical protein